MAIDDAIRLAEEVSKGAGLCLERSGGSGPRCDPRHLRAKGSGASVPRRRQRVPRVRRRPSGSSSTRERVNESQTDGRGLPRLATFRTRLANDMADLVAIDAFTAAVEAAEAVAHDDRFMDGASAITKGSSAWISAVIRRRDDPSIPLPAARSDRSDRRGVYLPATRGPTSLCNPERR